ncbi:MULTISPECIES: DUF2207 domain-containing protein [unclassified Microbacterium]|uniref:DUF2207 domain-containing protein n=1 Tax=unclassified Microbacterium TaxID=2609290 RepID=UPI00214B04F2|nr:MULTISPECIES: DUF2207 domain-containing protein [unclassified Microbacterium]MCR2810897.1 DUF2207 domain-containing protein [Microbacterium sp. zg.B185]WIM19700.1 DUF2207 domain-containing protein [Microbacterium sp. zg-B185]
MGSKLMRVLGIAFIAVGLPLALLAAPPDRASAADVVASVSHDVEDFSFESLDVEYTLGRDPDGASTLLVQERFVALFPEADQNRGMRRTIPETYLGAPLHPELVSITDGNGNPREAETDSEDGEYSMTSRADDYVHGAQTYVFTYRLQNVTRFFQDTGVDEFYWDVNGTAWPQEFGRVNVRVTVPADLAGSLTGSQACYVGSQGSEQTCPISTEAAADGAAAIVAAAAPVYAYQTVTLAIAFEEGTFTAFDSSYLASPWGWVQGIGGLGVLAAVLFAIVTRARRLRDAPGRRTIIAEYTPPPGIDSLESAVLLGHTTKAIPAEVLEQAVVGSIRIIEGTRKLFGGVKLKAQLIDPSRADGDGMLLLEGLFPALEPGAEYEFGGTDTRFSSAAQKILKLANQELTQRGLRREVPASVRAWPVLIAIGALILVAFAGAFALGSAVDPGVPILMIIGAVLGLLIVIGLISRKPLTAAGAEVRDHLKGLKEFIEWAEADRIRMLQSPEGAERVRINPRDPAEMLKLYEVLLPYAVVFGQEKQWAEQLAVLYEQNHSPGWYAGSHGFSAASFAAGISSLSASSSSSASTSGGSSGGGSAGGGGGGGGGGGV